MLATYTGVEQGGGAITRGIPDEEADSEDDADEETGFIDNSEVGKQGKKIKGALKKGY